MSTWKAGTLKAWLVAVPMGSGDPGATVLLCAGAEFTVTTVVSCELMPRSGEQRALVTIAGTSYCVSCCDMEAAVGIPTTLGACQRLRPQGGCTACRRRTRSFAEPGLSIGSR